MMNDERERSGSPYRPLSREISSPYRRNKLRGILRQVDQNKVSFGVEIVLARFIDDPQILAPRSRLIRDHLVDLARLEIRLRVRDAQRKTPSRLRTPSPGN